LLEHKNDPQVKKLVGLAVRFPTKGTSRLLRFIPGKKTLVEVTTRTVHSRLPLRPSNEFNEIVLGILGRAQENTGTGELFPRFFPSSENLPD
jgi:hypothetical protein